MRSTDSCSLPLSTPMDEMDVTFIRKPQSGRERHKWLLFGLLPAVAIIAVVVVCAVVFSKRGKLDIHNPEAARMLQKLDLTTDPCEDFYDFACGGFLSETEIPDDQVEVSMFTSAQDQVYSQLREVMEEPIVPGELRAFQLAKNYYKSCTDKSTIDSRGLYPMQKILKQVGGWPVLEQSWDEDSFVWWKTVAQLHSMGVLVDYLMHFVVEPDAKNSSYSTIILDQPRPESALQIIQGVSPESTDNMNFYTLAAYHKYLTAIAVLLGADAQKAKDEMIEVLHFYVDLSKIVLPEEKRRNMSEKYNPMTVHELQNQYPFIEWLDYLNGMLPDNINVTSEDRLILSSPTFFDNLTTLLNNTSPRVVANYVISQAVVATVKYLDSDIRAKEQQLQLELVGTTSDTEQWTECIKIVSDTLWSSVGAMYVRKFFKPETKRRASEMVKNIHNQFVEMLKQVDWMDEDTRKRGLEKAASMVMHVAYAEELLDDSKLDALYKDLYVDPSRYLENSLNISKFGQNLVYGRLRQKLNKTEWTFHSMPAIVNAFYSVSDNSIQIPAGILQGHFFSSERPSYMNYGAIGFVIGHEITHGFDDQGSQFDEEANLVDWWKPVTKFKYLDKTQCIIEEYENFTVMSSGLKLNGINTQGENIADNGGIKEAYRAYLSWVERNGEEHPLPGLNFNTRQMFWISAAQSWCTKYRPEAERMIVLNGAHAPGRFRVLGSFSNLDSFARDFSCPIGSPMNPHKKCTVW